MKANFNCAQGAYAFTGCSLATGGILNPVPKRRQSFNNSRVWRHTLQRLTDVSQKTSLSGFH